MIKYAVTAHLFGLVAAGKTESMNTGAICNIRIRPDLYVWLQKEVEAGRIQVARSAPRNGRKPRKLHQRYMRDVIERHIENLRNGQSDAAADAA